ncbi:MAG: hypothetical protein AB1486_21360 [Planctomycetota bacterium]
MPRFAVLLVVSLASYACGRTTAAGESEVHAAILRHIVATCARSGVTDGPSLVLQNQTVTPSIPVPHGDTADLCVDRLAGQLGIRSGALRALLERSAEPGVISFATEWPVRVVLASKEEIKEAFGPDSSDEDPDDRWEHFYKRYPVSHGWAALSRVAFLDDGSLALVYWEQWTGFLSGSTNISFMKRDAGHWQVWKTALLLIS